MCVDFVWRECNQYLTTANSRQLCPFYNPGTELCHSDPAHPKRPERQYVSSLDMSPYCEFCLAIRLDENYREHRPKKWAREHPGQTCDLPFIRFWDSPRSGKERISFRDLGSHSPYSVSVGRDPYGTGKKPKQEDRHSRQHSPARSPQRQHHRSESQSVMHCNVEALLTAADIKEEANCWISRGRRSEAPPP